MADRDQVQVLGFTKREAEVLIMSLQVIKPNRCVTNGCTAKPSDLVSIGAYENAETARSEYAALRARVMTLPRLPNAAATGPDASSKDNKNDKDQPNPFLLTEEETMLAADQARAGEEREDHEEHEEHEERELLSNKSKLGEGVVDEDLPTEAEWEAMGDQSTI